MSETNIGLIVIRSILRTLSRGTKAKTRHSAASGSVFEMSLALKIKEESHRDTVAGGRRDIP